MLTGKTYRKERDFLYFTPLDGDVFVRLNLYRKQRCRMDLRNFPTDSHQCCAPLNFVLPMHYWQYYRIQMKPLRPNFDAAEVTSPEWKIQNAFIQKARFNFFQTIVVKNSVSTVLDMVLEKELQRIFLFSADGWKEGPHVASCSAKCYALVRDSAALLDDRLLRVRAADCSHVVHRHRRPILLSVENSNCRQNARRCLVLDRRKRRHRSQFGIWKIRPQVL